MEKECYSWSVHEDTATKYLDTSAIRYNQSGIPVQIRGFWNADTIKENEKVEIQFLCHEKQFDAIMEKRQGRTRLNWGSDLRDELGISRFNFLPYAERKKACMIFKKMETPNRYTVSLVSTMESLLDEIGDVSTVYIEGKKIVYYSTKYERDYRCRKTALEKHGYQCEVCGFDFEKFYGEIGKKYIEIHHKKPLFSLWDEAEVNPETDMAPVCSNCHRMLHRRKDRIITIEELKSMINP